MAPAKFRTRFLITGAVASGVVVGLFAIGALSGRWPMLGTRTAESAGPPVPSRTVERAEQQSAACANCGVVESIRTVEVRGDAHSAESQSELGRGRGNAVATVVGASNSQDTGAKRVTYRVTARMEDGSYRTVSQAAPPAVAIGAEIRVVDGAVVPR